MLILILLCGILNLYTTTLTLPYLYNPVKNPNPRPPLFGWVCELKENVAICIHTN